jgi:hypothetical protein
MELIRNYVEVYNLESGNSISDDSDVLSKTFQIYCIPSKMELVSK